MSIDYIRNITLNIDETLLAFSLHLEECLEIADILAEERINNAPVGKMFRSNQILLAVDEIVVVVLLDETEVGCLDQQGHEDLQQK